MTYSMRLERQFGNSWMAGIAYVGNKVDRLNSGRPENPARYIPGASTVGNTQQRRIYPNYGPIQRTESSDKSSYNSVQLNLEKRFGRGFSILSNYVWSKTLETTRGQDPFDLTTFETAIHTDDVPHNFKFSAIWELPRAPLTGAVDEIVNGWQLNAVAVWQSGFPFGVSAGRDNSLRGGTDRANFVGGESAQLSGGRSHAEMIQQWFDVTRFQMNPIGTFGNAGRNILRGPKYFNTDFGLLKDFQPLGGVALQFRAEAFNVFNSVNFRLPDSNLSSSQFGRITQVVADSQRIIQLGLKATF
jgi:hypothetical protein